MALSHQASFSHSREGSNASSVSMPATPTFSARGYTHWPSSSSSLADSPVVTKSHLVDLAEEIEDHDDLYLSPIEPFDDHLCMCDVPFCRHEPRRSEWTSGDDSASLQRARSRRRKSSEYSIQALSSRFTRRFPSISGRWRDSQPTTSLSSPQVRTAIPQRSSSLRLPKVKSSLTSVLGSPPRSDRSFSAHSFDRRPRAESARRVSPVALDITAPPTPIEEEPIDRQSMSRTPLLPPPINDFRGTSDDQILKSPLQSPSVATPSIASSIKSPTSAPFAGIYTPPLSSSPSCASFVPHHYDMPPLDLGHESDPWALKLGHANFHILPEPYIPNNYTIDSCRKLLEDWESARTEYMRQAASISDDYGPNSQTFHLTEEKWAEIDAQWRLNHKLANEQLKASGEVVRFQPLAATAPTHDMPELSTDPAKFPGIDEGGIVGRMVQYAKVESAPTKKPGLLRVITDSASLFANHLRR